MSANALFVDRASTQMRTTAPLAGTIIVSIAAHVSSLPMHNWNA